MSIGTYRDRVTVLYRYLDLADSFGERAESWPDPGETFWARIEGTAGGEDPQTIRAGTAAARVRFRNVVPVAAADRVRLEAEGEVYAVAGVWRERAEHGGWQTVVSLSGPY